MGGRVGGWPGGWPGGRVGGCPGGWVAGWIRKIIIPLRGPSCKLRFARISDRLKFQDEPSVAILTDLNHLSDSTRRHFFATLGSS